MELTEKTALKDHEELNELDDKKMTTEDLKEETSSITKSEILLVMSLAITEFITGIYISMLGPFFPNEARKKGVSHMMIGLIFGIYNIVLIVMGPFLGYHIGKIGSKFMLITGMVSCGICSILLGFMDQSPSGNIFIALCLILRIVEGLGAAAFMTASIAIVSVVFPGRMATLFGILQTFTALGAMVGPPAGGFLFQAGGFRLPFLVTGLIMVILSIPSIIILPNAKASQSKMKFSSLLRMFSSPSVIIACVILLNISSMSGYLNASLSPVLINTFHLSSTMIGVFFLVASLTSAIASPLLGYVADLKPKMTLWMLIVGFIASAIVLFLLGPASTNPILRTGLVMIIIALVLEGFAMSFMGSAFQVITQTAREFNFPDNFETNGLISSILTSTFSLGEFLGPFAGGAVIDAMGFAKASTTLGYTMIAFFVPVLITTTWIQVKRYRAKGNEEVIELLNP